MEIDKDHTILILTLLNKNIDREISFQAARVILRANLSHRYSKQYIYIGKDVNFHLEMSVI